MFNYAQIIGIIPFFIFEQTMNPLLLCFADGTSFFVGLTVVALADLLFPFFRTGFLRSVLTIIALVGLILVIISATPLPFWAYALWLIPVVGSLVLGNFVSSSRNLRIIAGILVLVATMGLCLAEVPYHFLPRVIVPNDVKVYVLGDSLSAGMGTKEHCWPEVFEEVSGLSVVNLAEPGAKVQDAIKQADRIPQRNSMVIVEIGGNDLLGGTDPGNFHSQLDSLISSLKSKQHDILMFELPLFPFQNSFGKAQRDIAAKYGIVLLPKRFSTKVLGQTNGTLDGLHLSQDGHNALAAIIAQILEKENQNDKQKSR